MAQRAGEPQPSTALEGISTSVPPTLTLTPFVPLSTLVSHPLVHGVPLYSVGHWQTFPTPDPVIESFLVTTNRALETLLMASSPQGFVTFDTVSAAVTSAIGSLPFGQSVSLPLASGPSPTLHLSIPTNGSADVQYQHLMELAQALQGMALSVHPSVIPTALEFPLQLAPAFQALPTTPPPRPSP